MNNYRWQLSWQFSFPLFLMVKNNREKRKRKNKNIMWVWKRKLSQNCCKIVVQISHFSKTKWLKYVNMLNYHLLCGEMGEREIVEREIRERPDFSCLVCLEKELWWDPPLFPFFTIWEEIRGNTPFIFTFHYIPLSVSFLIFVYFAK